MILSSGEIDCREGILGAVAKKFYKRLCGILLQLISSIPEAVTNTVKAYLEGIKMLEHDYNLKVHVHPVPPPSDSQKVVILVLT